MKVNNSDHTKTATSATLPSEESTTAALSSSSSIIDPSSSQGKDHASGPRSSIPLNAIDPRTVNDARSMTEEPSLTLFDMDRYHWGQRSTSRLSSPSFIHQTTTLYQSILCSPLAATAPSILSPLSPSHPSSPSSHSPSSRVTLPVTDSSSLRSDHCLLPVAVSTHSYDPATLDFHLELDRFIGELSFDALSAWIPPFTRYTLRELEIASVLENVQVRHDLTLRPDLSFKPDESDVQLIQARQKDLKEYWEKVQAELGWLDSWKVWKSHDSYFKVPPPLLYPQLWPFQTPLILLPLLVNEIKEVILDILSISKKEIKDEIIRRLDLTSLLKRAQAGYPLSMEPWIHIFQDFLEPSADGHRKKLFEPLYNPSASPVELFKTFLEILEAMKLDLINKELNANKPYIIETAVRYEWSVFSEQLKAKETSTFYLENWYHDMYKRHTLGEKMTPEGYKNLYYQGIIDLISMNEYWSRHSFLQLPETFRLDTLNLKKAFDNWKELTIVQSSLLIYRQMRGKDAKGAASHALTLLEVKTLHDEMIVLLSDQSVSSAHLRAHLSRAISKARGVASLEEREQQLVQSLWNEYLTPGHRVHQLMTSRLRSLFLQYLQTGEFDAALLSSSGWQACAPTLKACLSSLKPVIDLNLATYRPLYNLLFKKFDAIFHAVYSDKFE